tara:strand:- start:9473 stop:10165 length:693 start_codon:yes stop_codon:yes gene_type:complete
MVEVVSEIGINWDGDFELLRDMINKSKDAGCNAIKLQAFERATCNNHPETDRLLSSSVTKNNIEKIDELAKNTGIEWFCTPMYSAAVEFLEPFLERFKIREIDARELVKGNTTELVDLILETKKPIIASAENIPIKHTDISNLKWLYCIPKYPCEYTEIDFEKMKFFDGYSNHCPSISAPIDAVKNGAKIIEVHTTLDKTKEFIDNNVSFDYNELTQLVEKIRMIEKELP